MIKDLILEFRIATQNWEFEQIHELNYQTFAEEIPQHKKNHEKKLIDKFHDQNTYIICVRHHQVIGMLAIRDQRPFSLDQKLDNLDSYLPPHNRICEVRLLSVRKEYRNTLIFTGLLKSVVSIGLERNYDLAIISGTTRQLKLYQHMGFKPFGPLVGSDDAKFQPMYLDYTSAQSLIDNSKVFRDFKLVSSTDNSRNYLPGPVTLSSEVREAFSAKATSHREPHFVQQFNLLKQTLCEKLNAENLQIMHGSGSLANDIVAAHLTALQDKGLILVNGEFSQRLTAHARAAGLEFDTIYFDEGMPVNVNAVENYIQQGSKPGWLWTTWCETSTGVLNNIEALAGLTKHQNIKLCVDAISAVGSLPVNLQDIYMATAVSGKGLSSLAGLALIFYQDGIQHPDQLPMYFNLQFYKQHDGIPFTISSNAIYALHESVIQRDWQQDYQEKKQWHQFMVKALDDIGLSIEARDNPAYHIVSIALPEHYSSLEVGNQLKKFGYHVSYQSGYLVKKNVIQICFMGECPQPDGLLLQRLNESISQTSSNISC